MILTTMTPKPGRLDVLGSLWLPLRSSRALREPAFVARFAGSGFFCGRLTARHSHRRSAMRQSRKLKDDGLEFQKGLPIAITTAKPILRARSAICGHHPLRPSRGRRGLRLKNKYSRQAPLPFRGCVQMCRPAGFPGRRPFARPA